MNAVIRDFPNYRIYSDGLIVNVINMKVQKTFLDHLGYARVFLRKDKKIYRKYLHFLLADAFIPNPDHLIHVVHKDLNKSNNSLSNLRWEIENKPEDPSESLYKLPKTQPLILRQRKKAKFIVGDIVDQMNRLNV